MTDALLGAPCGMGAWVAALAVLLLVALAAWGLDRLATARRGPPPDPVVYPPETPLRALHRRYVHGELSTQEYEEGRRLLGA